MPAVQVTVRLAHDICHCAIPEGKVSKYAYRWPFRGKEGEVATSFHITCTTCHIRLEVPFDLFYSRDIDYLIEPHQVKVETNQTSKESRLNQVD